MKVKVLSNQQVAESLDMVSVIEKVEEVYCLKSGRKAEIWPMIFHEFEPGVSDMDIKSGFVDKAGIYGLKTVSFFDGNKDKGIPDLFGTTMIFDRNTGAPLGILNAEHVTGMRTGAAGAVGAKYLARKDSEDLLLIGTGHQSIYLIAASLIALDHIKKVRICNPRNPRKSVSFAEKLPTILENLFLNQYANDPPLYEKVKSKFKVEFIAADEIEKAVRESDVILTATPSRQPLIMKSWLKPGTHLSCIGSDMPGKQEIDSTILANARIFVDDIDQAKTLGELELPIKEGVISEKSITAEIGELILGRVTGRRSHEEVTVFDSSGIALQDLLVSKLALYNAKIKNIGQEVDL